MEGESIIRSYDILSLVIFGEATARFLTSFKSEDGYSGIFFNSDMLSTVFEGDLDTLNVTCPGSERGRVPSLSSSAIRSSTLESSLQSLISLVIDSDQSLVLTDLSSSIALEW